MTFNEFYSKNFSDVVRHVSFKLHNQEEAEDFAQNVFMKLYVHWSKIDVEKASPRTYLFNMVKNALIDHYRVKNLGHAVSITAQEINNEDEQYENNIVLQSGVDTNPIQTLIGSDYADNFKRVLKTLPLLQKRCAVLYIQGFKMREIAERLGISTGTVTPMVRNLRAKFQTVYS